jgi:HD superfamily phosphodiesterase
MTMVTLTEVQTSPVIKAFIDKGNQHLAAMGFTDHGFLHLTLVSRISQEILVTLGYDKRLAELAGIAGYMHGRDFGRI